MPGLEPRKTRLDSEMLRVKDVTKTATATLNVREQMVYIDSTLGAMTITLAPVMEAKGMLFTFYVVTYSGSITLAAGDSLDFETPTFDGAGDGAVLYSDGYRWWTLGARTT